MYDYYLGGKDNFAADRQAAEQLRKVIPELSESAWANRRFHQRAAKWMARAGVSQFIDIGCGLPTMENTHQVVRQADPDARVVYVDYDPVVVLHGQALLAKGDSQGMVAAVRGDVREPEEILAAVAGSGLVSLDQPCGVLATAVLHFMPDTDDPHSAIKRLMAGTVAGSFLAVSQATADNRPDEQLQGALDVFNSSSAGLVPRAHAEVTRFFDGMELVPPWPGADAVVSSVTQWGLPEPLDPADPDAIVGGAWWAGVARKVS